MLEDKPELETSGLKFDANGLICTVVQSADTNRVLMVAWMNRESLALSLERGETVFWSRSRGDRSIGSAAKTPARLTDAVP